MIVAVGASRPPSDIALVSIGFRQVACRWMQAGRTWITAIALMAMAGFGGSLAALHLAWLDGGAFLMAAAGSLAAFAVCLTLGYLGDTFELNRQLARRSATDAEPESLARVGRRGRTAGSVALGGRAPLAAAIRQQASP